MLRKFFTLSAIVVMALQANAIIWHCDNFNSDKMTCRINGWSGSQPSSGKLKLPSSYTNANGKTYTVNAVRKDALNDLTDVTEITIPKTIVGIGDAKLSEAGWNSTEFNNFIGCTSLVKFIVEDGNPFFTTDEYGVLYYKNLNILYKVPAKMAVENGKYRIPDQCWSLTKDAFTNNSTVKELTLPSSLSIGYNGGLNKAKNIATYKIVTVKSDNNLYLVDGCLIDKKGSYEGKPAFISFPCASKATSCLVPSGVYEVGPFAFANTKNLIAVDLGSAVELGTRLTHRSSVEHITIPKTVKYAEKELFTNSPNLKEITIEAKDFICRDDFAHNCPLLSGVTSKYTIKEIKQKAFMNCPSLLDFPFDAGTSWEGDSILYKSGIKKAVFKGTVCEDVFSNGNYMFTNSPDLEKIDMSAIKTGNEYMTVGMGYGKNCHNLRTFIAPDFLWFVATQDMDPAFNATNLSEIYLGTFRNETYTPQFRYKPIGDQTEFTPSVYLALTRNKDKSKKYASMPLRNLFEGKNGAKVTPNFYCDLFDPTIYDYGNDQYDPASDANGNGENEYIASRGIYYVPGGCAENYAKVKESGRQVKQMFKLSINKEGSRMFVKTWTGESEVTNLVMVVNDSYEVSMGLKGEYDMPVPYKDVKSLLLKYKVNGMQMSTNYPPSCWDNGGFGSTLDDFNNGSSAVEEIENETSQFYQIFNLSGVKVSEGNGDIETSGLAKGIYILRKGSTSEKIIVK
ncbi:MAG: leucine-rich repeat domain-containing protein [Muribaculaceae bacterium]|nr:leucine-rich repeat domain-containing protein [Muribaculaceae bacterium]